ncbi:hypothetical protein IWW50_002489, partial [Coemansia erecta]
TDSEIEEIVTATPSRFKPRVVRRPVPVRAQSMQANNGGDDSDDSDEDFFRLHQGAPEEDANSTASDGNSSHGGGDKQQTPQATRDIAANVSVVDLDDSDDEDSEDENIDDDDDDDDDIGFYSQESSTGGKRKHLGGDTGGRKVRSRSVSLTPPPEAPGARNGHSVSAHPSQTSGSVHVVEESDACSLLDTSAHWSTRELDPSLQAVIQSDAAPAHTSRISSSSPHILDSPSTLRTTAPRPIALEKVQVEFEFIFDETFLDHELPQLWDPQRWGRVRSRTTIEKKLSEHIAVVAFTSDAVDKALRAYSDIFVVDVMATDPVLLMDRTMRVFQMSLLASLGDKLAFYIKVFPRSVFNRRRQKELLEQEQLAIEREQARRDLEMVQELRQNAAQTDDGDDEDIMYSDGEAGNDGGDGGAAAAPAATAGGIRIKIRDRAGKDTLLLVTAATGVGVVIENYRKLAGLDASVNVRLEFDDEALDPSTTIGDTDLEDDDMLTAYWN